MLAKIDVEPAAGAKAQPTGHSLTTRWLVGQAQYNSVLSFFVVYMWIDLEQFRAIAVSIFLASMASVVIWLATRIGRGLPHRRLFAAMSLLFAGTALARVLTLGGIAWRLPAWLRAGMQIFLPFALIVLSMFMFASIPMLLKVLKASDEVQSLRGQAKLRALVQAAPMAVVSADCDGKVTSWNPAAEKIFGWTEHNPFPSRSAHSKGLDGGWRTRGGEPARGLHRERVALSADYVEGYWSAL